MSRSGLDLLPATVAVVTIFLSVVTACREEDPVRTTANQGSRPTMVTVGVDTYVSDSGYVKYHAVTDIWEVYDDTAHPYWRFPKPLVIDILDPGMKPHSHIECDSAVYQTQRRLFRFDGDVVAINVNRDTFLTPQLYWDQRSTEFYTDSFIHIVKSDRILEGYGFRSNEKMTSYTILHPTAILPVSAFKGEKEPNEGEDSVMMVRDNSERIPVPASQRSAETGFDRNSIVNNPALTPNRR